MYISVTESRAKGFRRWSEIHQPRSNDVCVLAQVDVLAIATMDRGYAAMTAPEGLRAPWLVPGVGNTF